MSKLRKAGRPTALTQDTHAKIIAFIRGGGYVETAAAAAGVHKSTLYDWLNRGAKEEEGPFRAFADDVEKAMAESEMVDVARINKAAQDGIWQAAAWRLERKHPERWGRRDKTEVTAAREKAASEAAADDMNSLPDIKEIMKAASSTDLLQLFQLIKKVKDARSTVPSAS